MQKMEGKDMQAFRKQRYPNITHKQHTTFCSLFSASDLWLERSFDDLLPCSSFDRFLSSGCNWEIIMDMHDTHLKQLE